MVNNIEAKHQHVSMSCHCVHVKMLTLAFSLMHHSAKVWPHSAARIDDDF